MEFRFRQEGGAVYNLSHASGSMVFILKAGVPWFASTGNPSVEKETTEGVWIWGNQKPGPVFSLFTILHLLSAAPFRVLNSGLSALISPSP